MGMYDSLYVECPQCKNELQFQSKSGVCFLEDYHKNDLPPEVAMGMEGDIVRCQFCNNRIKLECNIPTRVKINLRIIGKRTKFNYEGNYNPKHPSSIKRAKQLAKVFAKGEKRE